MKKYINLDLSLDWREVLSKVSEDQVVLLNQPNDSFIIGWGNVDKISFGRNDYHPDKLQSFINKHQKDYIFGYLAYDIKSNETRHSSKDRPHLSDKDLFLFVPANVIIKTTTSTCYFGERSAEEIANILKHSERSGFEAEKTSVIKLIEQTSKDDYLKDILQIKNHIQNGIIYEMNYCVNFKNTFAQFNPVETYKKLTLIAEAPFSAFAHDGENYILSASPERFLNKKQQKLTSQPIKGTAKRGINSADDTAIKTRLEGDPKERSENIMIVDLVRNDLAKVAEKRSVTVEELCHPYTFKTVHQLISTISCQMRENVSFTEILQALFPMGSMTGAPKISAMSTIDRYESFRRGIYSGAIGYIEPNGNFDFNVVIRSILANMGTKTASCSVGGAITINSDPIKEYEECLLKLNAIQKALC